MVADLTWWPWPDKYCHQSTATLEWGTFHWQGGVRSTHTHISDTTTIQWIPILRPKSSPSAPIPPEPYPFSLGSMDNKIAMGTTTHAHEHTNTQTELTNIPEKKHIRCCVGWMCCYVIILCVFLIYIVVILMSFYKNWLIDWCKMLNGTFIIHIGTQWL